MSELAIRSYRDGDRDAIRALAYATGYMGSSPAFYWTHRESFAEIWTRYYTDEEPESLFVADDGGRAVGYLTGCVDSARAASPARAIVLGSLRHALFVRPGTAGFLWRAIADTIVQGGAPEGGLDDPRWPAHLHINLAPEARGRGAGAGLMRAWLDRLRGLGVSGCHLGTLHENRNAIGFFERMGLRRHGEPQLTPGLRSPEGGRLHAQLMVIDLGPRTADDASV